MERTAGSEENPQAKHEFEAGLGRMIAQVNRFIKDKSVERQIQALSRLKSDLAGLQARVVQKMINEGEGPRAVVCRQAEDIFGQNAAGWLWTSSMELGGQTPIERLNTEEGVKMVLSILGKIEHGVYS